jgi:hypothetical protein
MTIKTYKRSELRDIMDKRDALATKLGQQEAKRYLRKKAEETQPTGLIREALATLIFVIIMAVIVAFLLAL